VTLRLGIWEYSLAPFGAKRLYSLFYRYLVRFTRRQPNAIRCYSALKSAQKSFQYIFRLIEWSKKAD